MAHDNIRWESHHTRSRRAGWPPSIPGLHARGGHSWHVVPPCRRVEGLVVPHSSRLLPVTPTGGEARKVGLEWRGIGESECHSHFVVPRHEVLAQIGTAEQTPKSFGIKTTRRFSSYASTDSSRYLTARPSVTPRSPRSPLRNGTTIPWPCHAMPCHATAAFGRSIGRVCR